MKPFWGLILQRDISPSRRRRNRPEQTALVFLSLLLIIAAGTACGGKQQIRMAIESSKFTNPDDTGSPLPVVIRIYQLREKDKMEKAVFMSLWKSDQEILGEDLLERREVTLLPDSTMDLKIEADMEKGTKYIGIMALFRKPQGDNWRQILPVKEAKSVRITAHERSIKVTKK